jgi:hypothetical protein
MRLAVLAGVVAAGVLAPPAQACTRLPAPSATEVAIDHGLRVCAKGRSVMLARHARAASAAGHRVAWIEQRRRRGVRTAIVTLARVGRRVRVLRRFVAERRRTRERAELDVLLTREGDLAWTAGGPEDGKGVVAVKQPGTPVRRLADYPAAGLAIEDGRTLRWDDFTGHLAFFDLRREPCPSRSLYAELARNDRVILTRHDYGPTTDFNTVVRGCEPGTGRDRVILQNAPDLGEQVTSLVGLDRTWAVFLQEEVVRYDEDESGVVLTVADVATGRRSEAYLENGASAAYPAPTAAAGFAVTGRGVLGWLAGSTLYALTRSDGIAELDAGGTLAGLHAEGDALVWTHDGAPRRVVVTPG